jgi:5'-deoxynucleotidase YfbR-like HD superfamily hydrolase
MNIQDKLKAGTVNRWNIVSTVRPQTLAEHLFNVAMICEALAANIPSVPKTTVVYYGLIHDIEEVILGDLPTPTKARMKHKGLDWNKLVKMVISDEERLAPSENLQKLIKTADKMEALWFITTYGIGRHAELVQERMVADWEKWLGESHPSLAESAMLVWSDMMEGDIEI